MKMTREEITKKMAEKYPMLMVMDITFTPFGAYIHAVQKDNPNKYWHFSIDF